MRRSVLAIVAGLVLAVLAAAAVATIFAVPLADPVDGELPIWRLLRTALPVAAFALPGALAAVWLAEARRVRGLPYWVFIGGVLGVIGYLTLTFVPWPKQDVFRSAHTFMSLLAGGSLGGWLYWWMAGRRSGTLAAELARAGQSDLDEDGLRRRCRACTASIIFLGLLPLGLLGWHMMEKRATPLPLPLALAARAEMDGTQMLADAGLPWAALKIDNHVGRVTGTAKDAAARDEAFVKARAVLEPMMGLPGVFAYLQNDVAVPEVVLPAAPAATERSSTHRDARAKAKEAKRLAADLKRKADKDKAAAEAAAKAKAIEEQRLAAEAKRTAEAEAARAAAAAKARAIEEERLAAEAKRTAEADAARAEAAAKAKAVEEQRIAAETQRKADEGKRLALEAEAERNAVAAARKAEADEATAPISDARKPSPSAQLRAPASDPSCDTDFAETFKSTDIRFALNAATLDPNLSEFLNRVAELAKRCASYSLDIAGHADRTGGDAINLKTSLARAVAIRDGLIARGIAGSRLNAVGYGDSRPLDPSRNRDAFKRNRRVEVSAALTPPVAPPAQPSAEPVQSKPPQSNPSQSKSVAMSVAACNTGLSQALQRANIRFVENSAVVASRYSGALDALAKLALRCPNHALVINGHTDRRGSADANQKLSDARAHAIRNALVERSVPPTRLSAIGHGGLLPIVKADTRTAYALNRRVDFDVTITAPPPP